MPDLSYAKKYNQKAGKERSVFPQRADSAMQCASRPERHGGQTGGIGKISVGMGRPAVPHARRVWDLFRPEYYAVFPDNGIVGFDGRPGCILQPESFRGPAFAAESFGEIEGKSHRAAGDLRKTGPEPHFRRACG